MRAVVLAAGRGERLRPLTERLPKPLVTVAGQPLIHYTLSYLSNCGFQEVVINLHHLGEQIRDFVGDGGKWDLEVRYSWEDELLGTGGGIQKAASYLVNDTFVVMNSDIMVELDLGEVLRFHYENNAAVTMVLRKDPEVERFGVIEVDGYGEVKQFLGKLEVPRVSRRRLMFTGVHVLEPVVFNHMPTDRIGFSIVDVYLSMLRSGERIMGYETDGMWTDLGTPDRYQRFQELVEQGTVTMDRFLRGCR